MTGRSLAMSVKFNSDLIEDAVESCSTSRRQMCDRLGQLEGDVDGVVDGEPLQLKRTLGHHVGDVFDQRPVNT